MLQKHDLAGLAALAAERVPHTQLDLDATFLASGNSLAAPVRLLAKVTTAFVPQSDKIGEHLNVSANLIWAYALTSTYPRDSQSSSVVSLHEHLTLQFYLDQNMDGPKARVYPQRDESTSYGMDCGYSHQHLLGLARVDDPDRDPNGSGSLTGQYDPNASVTAPTRGCVSDRH